MFSNLSENIKGILLALLGYSAFAVSDAMAKYLSQYYAVVQIIGTVAIFTCALIVLISPFWKGGLRRALKTRHLKIHAVRGFCNIMISFLIVMSFAHLPLALVYTLVFTAPFITTLLAIPIFGEKVDPHGWAAIALGFAGTLIVFRPGFAFIDPMLILPPIVAIFVAGLHLAARALPKDEPYLTLAIFPALANLIIFAPPVFMFYELPDMKFIPVFLLQGIMLIIGFICVTRAFRLGKSSVVGPMHYTQILWGAGFGYLLFADLPDIWTVTGGAFIVGSGIYLIMCERRRYPPDHI